MTTFDYSRSVATATRMLQRYGSAATIKRETAGAYNPATGAATVTVAELATTAVVFDYPQKYIDGTLILQGDKQAYIAPGEVLKQGDKLAWLATDYRIVSFKEINPAGTVVLYEAQLRGQ